MCEQITKYAVLWLSIYILIFGFAQAEGYIVHDNAVFLSGSPEQTTGKSCGEISSMSRNVHGPIYINGNANFASQAPGAGWQGNGTQENPYIIENYEIDGHYNIHYCIWIENTDVWFVIRNCQLRNTAFSCEEPFGTGIFLKNVTHGKLENNICSGHSYGIYLDSSSDNTIKNNICSSNSWCGIALVFSNHTNLTNNTLWDSGIDIDSWSPEEWTTHVIENNTVNEKPVYYYKNQNGGTVPSDAGQVILANCTNMTVAGLTITNAAIGIQLGFSSDNTIENNTCVSNSLYGIRIRYSTNNTIINNTCSGNSDGISLEDSDENNIAYNTCTGNFYSNIHLDYSSSNNSIMHNTCSQSPYVVYSDCYGLSLFFSSNGNTITNNTFSRNLRGIYIYSSNNNTIANNDISRNIEYGVYITSCSAGNLLYHNYFWQNNPGSRGISGKSQAYDDVGANYWYDCERREGNYWSNWDGNGWGTSGAYPIDGGANAFDMYPLGPDSLIHIKGNTDFATQAQKKGWQGNGTQENPYIIEGYDFTVYEHFYGIWIENTDVWFVIRNCKLWGATSNAFEQYGTGIFLKNVSHGTIENNDCSNNDYAGIYISSSQYNRIVNNRCSGNRVYGIVLEDAANNTLASNNCSENYCGIHLVRSPHNMLAHNNCTRNTIGMLLQDVSQYNAILANNCSANSEYGICVNGPGASDTTISNNICLWNSGTGIYLSGVSNSSITRNICCWDEYGIYSDRGESNILWANNCSYNYQGVNIDASLNTWILYNNLCANENYGVNISTASTGIVVHRNNFRANNPGGNASGKGNSQAYDDGTGTSWYNRIACEGNYWSDWNGSGEYFIDGVRNASDSYPLVAPASPLPLSLIYIAGTEDFVGHARTLGWHGNGTQANPYIIDGYRVDARGNPSCIWIECTDVYLVIRNCTLQNASGPDTYPADPYAPETYPPHPCFAGIFLRNVRNAIIENCTCEQNTAGICLRGCEYVTIRNNTLKKNLNYGVYLRDSTDIQVYGNLFVANRATPQAYDNMENSWNTSENGNYWSDLPANITTYKIAGGNSVDNRARSAWALPAVEDMEYTSGLHFDRLFRMFLIIVIPCILLPVYLTYIFLTRIANGGKNGGKKEREK